MGQTDDNHVKILFRYHSPVLEEWTVETMWAEIVDAEKGLYKLDSIPFYGPLVASDDIIFAEYDNDEERLTYKKTVENSGNSIVTVVIIDNTTDINYIRDIFKELGCLSERVNDRYFSMEVLANNNYHFIKQKLTNLEDKGIIDYAEPCLSDNHRQQI
ncbi:hypothetical protein CAP36_07520 [Chitinophagaceae bacterium IBVUCB2]|nr:hypothetical protein CAP36_07520 [Chitinophagaceae bacterium IBVUCB2]